MMNREEQLAEIFGWLPAGRNHTPLSSSWRRKGRSGHVTTILRLPTLGKALLVTLSMLLLTLALFGFAGVMPSLWGGDAGGSIPQSDTAQSGISQSESTASPTSGSEVGASATHGDLSDHRDSPAHDDLTPGSNIPEEGEGNSDAIPGLLPPLRHDALHAPYPSWSRWVGGKTDVEDPSPKEQPNPSAGYQFLNIGPTGRPMLYSRCTPITVAVNPDGLPAEGQVVVNDTLAQLRELTGLTFEQMTGATHADDATVTISWETVKQNPQLRGALGLGGSSAMYSLTDPHGHLVRGKISLNADMPEVWTEHPITARGVLLHEFGHVLGLGHVPTTDTIMAPQASERMTLSDGDRAGFLAAGQGRCWEKD